MRTKQIALCLSFSLALFSCSVVSTPEISSAEDSQPNTGSSASSWLDIAKTTQSIDLFMVAVNNIISLQDSDSYEKITFYSQAQSELEAYINQSNLDQALLTNRFITFSKKINSVCGVFPKHEWSLVRTRVEFDRLSGFMDYRIENNDGFTWCSLKVENKDNQFKITNQFNHNYHFNTVDLARGFIELDKNTQIALTSGKPGTTTFYTEIEQGLSNFNLYLSRADVDRNLPILKRIRLELISKMTNSNQQKMALRSYVKPYGMSVTYPIQQLLFDLTLPLEEQKLLSSLKLVEDITGDQSQFKAIAAKAPRVKTQSYLTNDFLIKALLAEPTNSDIYFELFEWRLEQKQYAQAVESLRVLVDNLGYEFERSDFLKNDAYKELLQQPEFNAWLPKS